MGFLNASTLRALDGTGYSGIFGSDSSTTVVDSAGVTYHCPYQGNGPLPCTATDPNGNQISISSNGVTDTLGRVIPLPPNPNSFVTNPASSTWTVPGPNGASAAYTIGTNTVQITSITLPDQTNFTFQYQTLSLPLLEGQTQASTLSALSKVILPSGGSISYTYSVGGAGCAESGLAHPIVTSRAVDANDGKAPQTWQYNISTGTVTDPLGNKTVHTFGGGPCFPYETQTQQFDNGENLIKTVVNAYSYVTWPSANETPSTTAAPYDVLPTSRTTTWPSGQQSKVSYTYDRDNGASFSFGVVAFSNGQVNAGPQPSGYTSTPWTTVETDYGSGAPGPVLRTTNTMFQWSANPNYLTANLLTISATVTTLNGAGTQVAQTSYTYDESSYSGGGVLGNLTTTSRWLNTGGSLASHTFYNSHGMPTQTLDPRGNSTSYSYDGTGAFLSGVQYPAANGVQHTVGYTFDANTGAMTSQTDENGVLTSYFHNDPLGRLTQVRSAENTSQESWTTYQYSSPTLVTVAQDQNTKGDGLLHSSTVYDGLGRTLHQTGPNGAVVDTTYDGLGRINTVSNPHFTSSSPSDGTTTYTYDALSRMTVQTNQDGSIQQWSYSGNTVVFRDETQRTWQRTSDALGRLTNVVESTGATTSYSYDAPGNLWTVNQQGVSGETPRVRSFTYDSLSRLLSATNPETGTVGYGYDANGNMMSKTDARGITTVYVYDALNRLTNKSSAGGSGIPGFNYTYGYDSPSEPNGIGRLLFTTTSAGTDAGIATQYFYDAMGRLIGQSTGLPSTPDSHVSLSATYNLTGNMTSLTYPDGRMINQTWDGGGHLIGITDVGNGSQYLTPQSSYLPNGSPSVIYYGNGVGHGYVENSRMQLVETGHVRIGSSAPGSYTTNTNLITKEYCYGPATSALSSTIPGCPALGSADNGNMLQVTDTLNGNFTQSFSYDGVNRLSGFSRADGGMSQTYQYDSFGNLNQPGGTLSGAVNILPNNQLQGTGYDGAGNATTYNNSVFTTTFAYDSESKLTNVNNGAAVYIYDADGTRVRKDVGSDWQEYVNFNGQTVAEKNDDGTWSDYIFANGQRIARVDNYDVRIHMSGTNCPSCSSTQNTFAGITSLTAANGYTIRTGDVLSWRQYQDGSTTGGLLFTFNPSTGDVAAQDTDGQPIDQDTTMNTWHMRTVDLSPYAGKVIGLIDPFQWTSAPAGNWDIYYGDIVLTSTDGTSIPIYSRSMTTFSLATNAAVSNFNAITEKVPDTITGLNVTYYHGDQVGSTVIQTDSAGWPVASDAYYPFGQENSPPALTPPELETTTSSPAKNVTQNPISITSAPDTI